MSSRGLLKSVAIATTAIALNLLSVAAQAAPLSLTPFSAAYELDWKGGISLSGKTTRQLSQDAEGTWHFLSQASATFAGIKETSQFIWQGQQIKPLHYTFKRSVLGKKRTADVSFNWEKGQITNTVANKPWQMPTTDGVQDKVSYQLLLQAEVAQGKQRFEYAVADGGKLKTYQFKVEGSEEVSAPIGTYNAIKVSRVRDASSERQTYIWFAPALDYQIIKLQQVEKKGKHYTLLLKTLEQ